MNVEEIRKYCMSFSDTTEKLQWGDALCFKVRGKMFAVIGLDRARLTFKCTPESFAELMERENIRKAPYLGHRNWVMLERLDALPWGELQEFIRQSYEMAAAKTPAKARKKASAAARKTLSKSAAWRRRNRKGAGLP